LILLFQHTMFLSFTYGVKSKRKILATHLEVPP
jgi:hypothetical protein